MVFGGNRSDCSTVLFPRMGHGMGQTRETGQGRAELYTLRPVSTVRRFEETDRGNGRLWAMNDIPTESGHAEIAPLKQRNTAGGEPHRMGYIRPPVTAAAFENRLRFLLVFIFE